MKTWITHSLAVLASLSYCFGFVSPAGAQSPVGVGVGVGVTSRPAAVSLYLIGNPTFNVTYSFTTRLSICSSEGKFLTDPNPRVAVNLGTLDRAVKVTPARRSTLEEVIVPAVVIAEVKRRRITKPVYYSRNWRYCGDDLKFSATTDVRVTLIPFSVEAVPGTARVAASNDTLVPLRWRAIFGDGVSTRVESREGRFVDGLGRVYGATVRDLLQASGRSPLEFSETLRVPESVVQAVLAAPGTSVLSFERTFTVEGVPVIAAVRLQFTSRIASPFSISRAELRFLDGSRFRTVPLGEEVLVEGDITFNGSGRLQASWDVAGPTTTTGAAIFVRKQLVDEYLSFGRRTVIRSPAIKAEQQGTYIVRLSITSPNLGDQGSLELSYVVRATGEAMKISLGLPKPLARLSPGLLFTWAAVAGAHNYLLEFYEMPTAEGREPAAGMVLPGGASRAALSQATEHSLQRGRTYWWRVVALGPDGVLLGQSALRELLTPQE